MFGRDSKETGRREKKIGSDPKENRRKKKKDQEIERRNLIAVKN